MIGALKGRRQTIALVGMAVALVIGFASARSARGYDPTNPNVTLSNVEQKVARSYSVPEITDAELATKLAAGKSDARQTILFDVREEDEFEQSHLSGARRIDPGMSADAFIKAYGAELKGRTVVFYCAVGVRSGVMLARVRSALDQTGATGAYNLRGGIFRWHTNGHRVVAQSGPASSVHSYDASWGQLLDRTLQSRGGPK
jgi:rhodanese-related sulfurtransferase